MTEIIASTTIPQKRLVVAFDPGNRMGEARLAFRGRDLIEIDVGTIHVDSPWQLALVVRERFLYALSHRGSGFFDHFHVAIEGWTWYGGSSERARGLPSAAHASGFVDGLAQMFMADHPRLDQITTLTRPMILKSLGLKANASKAAARLQVQMLVPRALQKALDGASEHAYDAVAVALAADALLANPLAAAQAKTRRGRR